MKRIYREYLEGKSYYEIGNGLTADGIRTAAGSEKWLASTLRKILRNEKYIGDALLQKTVTTDFLTKKRVENKGLVPQYCVCKSWADSKTQKGAFKILDNAKKCEDQNPRYKVFDADGNIVYEPKGRSLQRRCRFW